MINRSYLLFIFLGFWVFIAQAQLDIAPQGFSLKAGDTAYTADLSYSLKLSPIQGFTRKNISYKINYTPIEDSFKKTSGVNIVAKSTLKKPTWDVKQPFIEDQKDVSKFGKDYFLGDVKTTSKTVMIKCRDHEYVDGDRIRLMVNDVVVHPNLILKGEFYSIDIDLKEGFNTINFIALNEGLSRPNTAQLRVYDENGTLLAANKWLITTGYKASMVILKE